MQITIIERKVTHGQNANAINRPDRAERGQNRGAVSELRDGSGGRERTSPQGNQFRYAAANAVGRGDRGRRSL